MPGRFRSGRRGVSTILGGLIMLTVVLMILNVVFYYWTQYEIYQQTVRSKDDRQLQAGSEFLEFAFPGEVNKKSYMIGSQFYYDFDLSVRNLGSSSVKIVRLYIVNQTNAAFFILDSQNSLYGRIGQTFIPAAQGILNNNSSSTSGAQNSRVLQSTWNITVRQSTISLDNGKQYRIILVTQRGNLFTTAYPLPVTFVSLNGPPGTGQIDFGSIRLDQLSYKLTALPCKPSMTPAFTIKGPDLGPNAHTLFSVTLTNIGQNNITIDYRSFLFLIGNQGNNLVFYIVDKTTNSSMANPVALSTPVNLLKNANGNWAAGGPPVSLLFGAKTAAQSNAIWASASQPAQTNSAFLVLFGQILSNQAKPYAQTIPFEATLNLGGNVC